MSRTVLTICFKPLAFLQRRNVSCYHGFWWHSTASKTSVPAFDCLVPESAVRSHSWEENKQTQTELPKERFRDAHWKYGRKQGNLCMVCLLQWNFVPPKLREQDLSLPSIWLLRSIDFSLKLKTWAYTVFSLQIRIHVWENLVVYYAHLTYSGRWFSLFNLIGSIERQYDQMFSAFIYCCESGDQCS